MDHRSSINKLGRNSAHRKALLKAQAKALEEEGGFMERLYKRRTDLRQQQRND